MSKVRRASRFPRFLLVYSLLLLTLGAAALFLLNRYLTVFEATRPQRAVEVWQSALESAGPGPAALAALDGLDEKLVPEEQRQAFLSSLLSRAELRERISAGDSGRKDYSLLADGRQIGTLRLIQDVPASFKLKGWRVEGEEYDLGSYFTSASVTVPSDYSVFLGETRLDSSFVTDDRVPYGALRECYEQFEDMPYMLRYETGPTLGGTPLRVLDTRGREVPESERTEAHYLDNCDEETRTALEAFTGDFLGCYIAFTAAVEQGFEESYSALIWKLYPGSPLHQRLSRAAYDKWWSNTRSCRLEEMDVHFCTDLGNGSWLVDLSYVTRTVAFADPVVEKYNVRLVVRPYGDSLRASNLFNY